jgi:PBSX family phage terminase large subunit
MGLSFVVWAMETFNGEHFGMAGKTIQSFERNVLTDLPMILRGRGYKTTYHHTDKLLTVSRGGTENYFWVFGGKDESSKDVIQGVTLAGVFCDEAALMPESFVNQITSRCSVAGSKLWLDCNPGGPAHWFKTEWIDKADTRRLCYLHFTMDDNLSLAEEIKESYRRMYTGVFYRRFIAGEWAVAEGVIYDMFDYGKHVITSETLIGSDGKSLVDSRADKYISVDYGTQNAMVFLLWNRLKDGTAVCTKEYYWSGRTEGRQKTDSEYADDLEAWLPHEADSLGNMRPVEICGVIIDPSAASFIAELKRRGIPVQGANNAVLDGIRLTSTLLNLGRIRVSAECIHTIDEFGMYAWDEKAVRRGEDVPIKENDHTMDAVRYYVYTVLRREYKWLEAENEEDKDVV